MNDESLDNVSCDQQRFFPLFAACSGCRQTTTPSRRSGRSRPARRPHRRQPLFGFIKEGVNLLHLVTRPQTGKRELLFVGLISCQRGLPDPKKRVTKLFPEGVHLRRRVALPQTGGG